MVGQKLLEARRCGLLARAIVVVILAQPRQLLLCLGPQYQALALTRAMNTSPSRSVPPSPSLPVNPGPVSSSPTAFSNPIAISSAPFASESMLRNTVRTSDGASGLPTGGAIDIPDVEVTLVIPVTPIARLDLDPSAGEECLNELVEAAAAR